MSIQTSYETPLADSDTGFSSSWAAGELHEHLDESELVHHTLESLADSQPGTSRYTEIHVAEGEDRPIIVVSPRGQTAYGATVEGTHSIIDEMRSYGEGALYPETMAFADQHHLDTSTVKAKGRVVKTGEGDFDLYVDVVRRRSESNAWMVALKERAEADGFRAVMVRDDGEATRSYDKLEIGKRPVTSWLHRAPLLADELPPEAYSDVPVIKGFVQDFDTREEWARNQQTGTYEASTELHMRSVDARAKLHGWVYEAAGEDPAGYQTIKWNGKQFRVGARYEVDRDRRVASLAIFFPEDYGEDGDTIQRAIADGIAHYFVGGRTPFADELEVLVSKSRSSMEQPYVLTQEDVRDG